MAPRPKKPLTILIIDRLGPDSALSLTIHNSILSENFSLQPFYASSATEGADWVKTCPQGYNIVFVGDCRPLPKTKPRKRKALTPSEEANEEAIAVRGALLYEAIPFIQRARKSKFRNLIMSIIPQDSPAFYVGLMQQAGASYVGQVEGMWEIIEKRFDLPNPPSPPVSPRLQTLQP